MPPQLVNKPTIVHDEQDTKVSMESHSKGPRKVTPEEQVLLPTCPVEVTESRQQLPSAADHREAYKLHLFNMSFDDKKGQL